MSNYMQTNVSGTAYVRSSQVIVANPLVGTKAISFMEEQVVNLDGEQIVRQRGGVQEPFTAENAGEVFQLINPQTGEALGSSASYQELYIMLHSLYLHLATKRDNLVVEAAPIPEVTPEISN